MSNFNTQHHRTSSIPSYSSANSLLINNHSCCRASVNGVCFTPAPTLVLVSNQLTTSLFRHHQLPFTLEQLLEYQEIYTQLSVLEGTTAATPINDTSISYFQKRIQNLTCTIADKKDKIECLSRKTRTEWNMSTRRKSNTLSYKFTSMIRRSSSSNIIKETIYARGQAVNTDIDRFRETLKQEKSEIQSLADLEVELEGLKKQLAKALEKSNTKKLLETRLGIVLNSIFEGPTTPEYPDEDRLEVSLRTLELEYTAVEAELTKYSNCINHLLDTKSHMTTAVDVLMAECTRVSSIQYFSFNVSNLTKIRQLLLDVEKETKAARKSISSSRSILPYIPPIQHNLSPPNVSFFFEIDCTSILDEFKLRDSLLQGEEDLRMAKNQITALADKLNAEFYSVSETGRQIALKVTEVKMQLREMRIGIMNDNIRRLSHSNSIE